MEVSVLQDILGSVLYYRRVYFWCNGRNRYCGDGIFHGAADCFFQQNGGGAAAVWEGAWKEKGNGLRRKWWDDIIDAGSAACVPRIALQFLLVLSNQSINRKAVNI